MIQIESRRQKISEVNLKLIKLLWELFVNELSVLNTVHKYKLMLNSAAINWHEKQSRPAIPIGWLRCNNKQTVEKKIESDKEWMIS